MIGSLQNIENFNILIIESSSALRQIYYDALKEKNFDKVTTFSTAKDALSYMEVETPKWIIMPSFISQDINIFHILSIIIKEYRLRKTLVSLFTVEQHDEHIVPLAFENGLFTWHKKSNSKAQIFDEFSNLLSVVKIHKFHPVLTSASYVRMYLNSKNFTKSMLPFEENLLRAYPAEVKNLINLAEAQFHANKVEEADKTLAQICLVEPRYKHTCKRIRKKHFPDEDLKDLTNIEGSNILGVQSCMVIDPDSDMLQFLQSTLTQFGIKKIETFESGEEALSYFEDDRNIDLILMEWRIVDLKAHQLIQRIRGQFKSTVPIILISSLVEDGDIPIIEEMGVDSCLKKPFEQPDLLQFISKVVTQIKKPTDQKPMEIKIRRYLKEKKLNDAKKLYVHYVSHPEIDDSDKISMECEYHYGNNSYNDCINSGLKYLNSGKKSIQVFNTLGKAFMKKKNYEKAQKCFESANSISSDNIDRLLNLSEVHMKLDNSEKAGQCIDQAKCLDSESLDVMEADYKNKIANHDIDGAKKAVVDLPISDELIAYLNNRAIALVKNGRFQDGLNSYETALKSLPIKYIKYKNPIIYNVSLCNAKFGNIETALDDLKEIKNPAPNLAKKVESLITKLKNCIKNNSELKIIEEPDPEETVESESDSGSKFDVIEFLKGLEIEAGELCCYKLFYNMDSENEDLKVFFNNPPKFSTRSKIERKETFSKIS